MSALSGRQAQTALTDDTADWPSRQRPGLGAVAIAGAGQALAQNNDTRPPTRYAMPGASCT